MNNVITNHHAATECHQIEYGRLRPFEKVFQKFRKPHSKFYRSRKPLACGMILLNACTGGGQKKEDSHPFPHFHEFHHRDF